MITLSYAWQTRRLPRPRRNELKALAAQAAVLAGLPDADWELVVRFVGERAMTAANEKFVGHPGTTDVITFSYFDDPEPRFSGEPMVEIIICVDAALREGAARKESSYARELVLYLVHGLLHSAGEDDLSPKSRRRMRRREREVLEALGKEFDFHAIFPDV